MIDDETLPKIGIITSHVGGVINITNTLFDSNVVGHNDTDFDTLKAIIFTVELDPTYSNNTIKTELSLSDSVFVNNEGMTFALVMAGLWSDSDVSQSNNTQGNNELFQPYDHACYGVGQLNQDYYYYYDYYNKREWDYLNSTQFQPECLVSFAATESDLELTLSPTSSPTNKISQAPSTSDPTSITETPDQSTLSFPFTSSPSSLPTISKASSSTHPNSQAPFTSDPTSSTNTTTSSPTISQAPSTSDPTHSESARPTNARTSSPTISQAPSMSDPTSSTNAPTSLPTISQAPPTTDPTVYSLTNSSISLPPSDPPARITLDPTPTTKPTKSFSNSPSLSLSYSLTYSSTNTPTSSSPTSSSHPSSSPTDSNSPSGSPTEWKNCWAEDFPEKVRNEELKLGSKAKLLDPIRIYRMCPGSTAKIAKYDWDNKEYNTDDGSSEPLVIWNSNVHIVCGWNHTDCTFTGGSIHIEVSPANYIDKDFKSRKLQNIVIKGIQFTKSEYTNVLLYGYPITYGYGKIGSDVTITESKFYVSFLPYLPFHRQFIIIYQPSFYLLFTALFRIIKLSQILNLILDLRSSMGLHNLLFKIAVLKTTQLQVVAIIQILVSSLQEGRLIFLF